MKKRDVINDVNIVSREFLATPAQIRRAAPLGRPEAKRIAGHRAAIRRILDRRDRRLLVVVGPCSIHNIGAGLAYARKLRRLSERVSGTMMLAMRVYFEKPRTSVGWKGFINDPRMDDSFRIGEGLARARRFLLRLAEMGLPAATEALDTVTPQYIGDLISWTAVGARTTESQTHREMASGLSTPVGFKNGTDGSIAPAVNALKASRASHHFLGIATNGRGAVFHTRGNRYGHIVLRGGRGPNYGAAAVRACRRALVAAGLPPNIMIDCSHGNSGGVPERQPAVMRECVGRILRGEKAIVGFMIEGNLRTGRQAIAGNPAAVRPDVSVTDACLGWPATERMLIEAHRRLEGHPGRRHGARSGDGMEGRA